MSSSVSSTLAEEIRNLHSAIEQSLRRTVDDAIRIGELLEQARKVCTYGEFGPWIHENLPFSQATAYRYLHIFEHRRKLLTVRNLQEAYRIVEQIETDDAQRKRRPATEATSEPAQEANQAVVDEEPEPKAGLDPEDKAKIRDIRDRMDRKDAAAREEQARSGPMSRDEVDEVLRQADAYMRELQGAAERFSHLTLSGGVDDAVQTGMLGLVRRYVQSFQPAARQVEVAHNLIKAIRLIIHEVNGEEASA